MYIDVYTRILMHTDLTTGKAQDKIRVAYTKISVSAVASPTSSLPYLVCRCLLLLHWLCAPYVRILGSLFPDAAAHSCLPMHETCACRFALGASAPCLRFSAVFRRGAAAYADACERKKTRKCSFLLYLLLLFC